MPSTAPVTAASCNFARSWSIIGALRNVRSTTAFRRCDWLFNSGMAMLFRIKDGHMWTWISFLYFLGCLFGRFVRLKSGLKLSINCHVKLLDERRPGAYWRRISVLVFRGGGSPLFPWFKNFRRLYVAITADPLRPRASPLQLSDS
jgi:hypothetical protein